MTVGLQYGFRNPPHVGRPVDRFYQQSLEQIRWADTAGFGSIWVSEHHFKEDGDLPSPLILASAVLASTKNVRVATNIILLPLHHPLRVAEESAILSIISGGRFQLGVGAGYVDTEFAAFGEDLALRPTAMEEGIEILRQAWTGKRFRFQGKRWDLPEIAVSPFPPSGEVPLFVGGITPAGVRRAARLGDGFIAGYASAIPTYLQELDKNGKGAENGRVAVNQWAVIAEDPERAWETIGPHAVRQLNHYVATGGWGDAPPFADAADVLNRGAYVLWDGPQAVSALTAQQKEFPQITDQILQSFVPGESVDSSNERLEYIARAVLPHL